VLGWKTANASVHAAAPPAGAYPYEIKLNFDNGVAASGLVDENCSILIFKFGISLPW